MIKAVNEGLNIHFPVGCGIRIIAEPGIALIQYTAYSELIGTISAPKIRMIVYTPNNIYNNVCISTFLILVDLSGIRPIHGSYFFYTGRQRYRQAAAISR